MLQYTNRRHLVSRRLVLGLAVEPVLVMAVLLTPATHDLVRSYPPSVAAGEVPVVAPGPLFWVHFADVNVLLLVATVTFVRSLARASRPHRRSAMILVAAALLPWTVNVLHNLAVGPFARVDLTPFAFVVTGAVLYWGLFRQGLVNLAPVARHLIVETMADPVLVIDPFGRVVDANSAAAATFGRDGDDLVGRWVADLLPRHPALASRRPPADGDEPATAALALPVNGLLRHFDVRRQPLPGRAGQAAGQLLVLRDVTERTNAENRLRQVLAERTRIATVLQDGLLPSALPPVDGLQVAARYHPAGDGLKIGGDFYDVYPLDGGEWAVVLGDVSGKGAEAAAATALGGAVEAVGRHGTLLGLFDEPELHEVDVVLGPGDVLCLFTDGLVEARSGADQLGVERVADILRDRHAEPAQALAEALEQAARGFHGGDLTDDLAVVVLQVPGAIGDR